jgi:hypothetical protein
MRGKALTGPDAVVPSFNDVLAGLAVLQPALPINKANTTGRPAL